jgi:hypothetical protein
MEKKPQSGWKPAAFLLTAGLIGMGIGYVDTRPNWDDTGITAGALFVSGLAAGAVKPRWFWLTGLALGLPVLAMNVAIHGNYGSAIAVAVALVAAGIGAAFGTLAFDQSPAR